MSQPNFSTIEESSIQNNHQPVGSILKKSSSQLINNSFSTQITTSKEVQEFRKSIKNNFYSIK